DLLYSGLVARVAHQNPADPANTLDAPAQSAKKLLYRRFFWFCGAAVVGLVRLQASRRVTQLYAAAFLEYARHRFARCAYRVSIARCSINSWKSRLRAAKTLHCLQKPATHRLLEQHRG